VVVGVLLVVVEVVGVHLVEEEVEEGLQVVVVVLLVVVEVLLVVVEVLLVVVEVRLAFVVVVGEVLLVGVVLEQGKMIQEEEHFQSPYFHDFPWQLFSPLN
jgi:hypothetical protein